MPHGLHDPGCKHDEHCYIHNEDEPDLPDDYRVCGECLHVFRTVEELVREEKVNYPEGKTIVVGDHEEPPMYACPLCTHDF